MSAMQSPYAPRALRPYGLSLPISVLPHGVVMEINTCIFLSLCPPYSVCLPGASRVRAFTHCIATSPACPACSPQREHSGRGPSTVVVVLLPLLYNHPHHPPFNCPFTHSSFIAVLFPGPRPHSSFLPCLLRSVTARTRTRYCPPHTSSKQAACPQVACIVIRRKARATVTCSPAVHFSTRSHLFLPRPYLPLVYKNDRGG